MEEKAMLWMLSFVMLVGSCLAGSLPLLINLSEDKLQLVSILGAGLLVGTALAVIIPEGIKALFTSNPSNGKDHDDLHSLIGISLVLGFVFMLLIDQCSARRSGGRQKSVTATLGLVVHAAVDGVALGAAATTSQADVEVIVFIAIMLHKAPAAFGLVSFLLHECVDKKKITKHLLIFSLAAPCLALVTYFGIGKEGKETLSNVRATGVAMLFSAGTFLYVATVHVLPELMTRHNNYSHLPSVENNSTVNTTGLKVRELSVLVLGSCLPALITTGHHH
ncbi:zinc transporter ZIP9 [Pseudomyrmex gracilis]|uniref:zinc transporter ZIP9 n=1 Tax=Pseudomyrmex gracilis TaxID=219809 RepID=UPI000995C299|nr:zinc transporter ZIP9 [Pseudomyrmex gracilis]XP_020299932.1 zinc transporter ZIP9 [Pseudomyrmex gracilis]XP_020299933.1 zinc transporter ZIP9 [Pseudomyrmex gracilis]XP_020299935.1 zinc transporter ZIP9 [Pseudomyrmex gracilis]XP_020299936.1 zinc transporter ZIP9 [Pseudomyrmex gracilis]XP_020299937.1 zinc transporter ZIP9 [Pseudomyrmex gracilis]